MLDHAVRISKQLLFPPPSPPPPQPASQTVLHVESLGLSAPPGSDRLAAQNASLAAAAGQPPGAQGPPPARSPPTAAWLAQHEAALAAAALAGKAKPATRGAWPQNGNAAGARGKPKARPAAAAAAAAAATAGHGPVSGPSSGGGSGEGASPGAATPPEAAANAKPSNKTKPKAKVDPKPKAEGAPAAAAAADTAAAAADESDEEEAGDAEAGFLKVMDYKNYFKQIRVPAAEGRRIFPPASSPLSIRGPDGRIFQCTYTFFDYGVRPGRPSPIDGADLIVARCRHSIHKVLDSCFSWGSVQPPLSCLAHPPSLPLPLPLSPSNPSPPRTPGPTAK